MAVVRKLLTRVLVVDDSPVACKVLTALINSDPQMQVVGTAGNGQEAIQLARQLVPDLITMDVQMPVMDGLEATKQIMAYQPTPILIISSVAATRGAELVFKAMSYGALDVMDKEALKLGETTTNGVTSLTDRIKTLSRVRVIPHPLARMEAHRRAIPKAVAGRAAGDQIVAIGSSTGGPEALRKVLTSLPADLGCGVVIVQHIAGGFDKGLADWLDGQCDWNVRLGSQDTRIEAGFAYVAPSGRHMRVANGGIIQLTNEPERDGQKPSATVLFESVAQTYGTRSVAVILTGMGRDGAEGLKKIKQAGGYVIAQDEASCVVFGMPKAAMEAGAVDAVRSLEQMGGAVALALRHRREAKVTK